MHYIFGEDSDQLEAGRCRGVVRHARCNKKSVPPLWLLNR